MLPSDHLACFRPPGAVKGRWPYTRACFSRDLAKSNVRALAVSGLIEQYGDASAPDLLRELTGCPKWQSRATL
jgi:hypothetical protein